MKRYASLSSDSSAVRGKLQAALYYSRKDNREKRKAAASPWSPADLFGAGVTGFYFDFSKIDRLKQDSGGTVDVVEDGDPVARAISLDPSLALATILDTARPAWKTGGLLRFDGVNDALNSAISPSASGTLAFKGMATSKSGGNRIFIGSTNSAFSNRCYIQITDATGVLTGYSGGANLMSHGTVDILNTPIIVAMTWIAGGVSALYVDGEQVATGTTGTMPEETINLGSGNHAGANSNFLSGDLNHALFLNRALSAIEIAQVADYWGIEE